MNTFAYLGVCIFGFFALPSTAQYLVDTDTGRAFNLLNLFNRADKTGLSTRVANLEDLLARRLPKCPSTAPILSVVLGATCYSVTVTPTTWDAARTACENGGGTLATPLPRFSPPLLTALKAAFPAIGTSELWIGASVPAAAGAPPVNALLTAITYVTTGLGVLPLPVFDPAATQNALAQGAFLTNPAGAWSVAVTTLLKGFVCQYDTLN